jgi:hypothetical protein
MSYLSFIPSEQVSVQLESEEDQKVKIIIDGVKSTYDSTDDLLKSLPGLIDQQKFKYL